MGWGDQSCVDGAVTADTAGDGTERYAAGDGTEREAAGDGSTTIGVWHSPEEWSRTGIGQWAYGLRGRDRKAQGT